MQVKTPSQMLRVKSYNNNNNKPEQQIQIQQQRLQNLYIALE